MSSDACGWLAIRKPSGMTSTDVVRIVRKTFSMRRVGHAGSLDPSATGVLLVAVGEATKLMPLAMESDKVYRFTIAFGAETDTDDATGEALAESDQRPANSDIERVIGQFEGDILQVPPRYSALKVSGKRAHQLAREGKSFNLAPRRQRIHELRMIDRVSRHQALFEVRCNKGTYVRSLARDIGRELGCLGHADKLERTGVGSFRLEDCISLEDLRRHEAATSPASKLLLPIEAVLDSITEHPCTPAELERVQHGNPIGVAAGKYREGEKIWLSDNGMVRAIAVYRPPLLKPKRVFGSGTAANVSN
ncbi:MAG: tRNA pseudouridine(55) synthase TruB [Rhodobacteraceae bacterium]|nr:tRNA pseudouridine(55) synthase TruB [Paracoccaceae bacterium]